MLKRLSSAGNTLNSRKCEFCKTSLTFLGHVIDQRGITADPNKTAAISRLTVVSREAKKKQHACASSGLRDHYSELFTRMAALKF